MVYKCPFDISVICTVFGLPSNKFYRWFKECLTDFKTEEGQLRLHQHDFQVQTGNGHKTILVPILRPEHFDVHMAIDEKHINGEFYTVLTNVKTGKVALLCSTIKTTELKICLDKFDPSLLDQVEYMTLDLSPTFELVVSKSFPKAIQIADKFRYGNKTNAIAESVNAKIKEATRQNKGSRDLDFFHFRIAIII